jgi:hypothetical protein
MDSPSSSAQPDEVNGVEDRRMKDSDEHENEIQERIALWQYVRSDPEHDYHCGEIPPPHAGHERATHILKSHRSPSLPYAERYVS